MIAGSYQDLLGLSQSIYQQVLGGYTATLAGQQSAQAGVIAGYGNLENSVLGAIKGVDKSQRQQILDVYTQQQGAAQQGLVNSGLGNTTVTSSVNRGLLADREKSEIALSNQMAQLKAGYMSQIGLAGLGYQGQAIQQNTGVALAGLGFQGTYAEDLLRKPPYQNSANANFGSKPFNMAGGSGGGGSPGNWNANPSYQDPYSAMYNRAQQQGPSEPSLTLPGIQGVGGGTYGGGGGGSGMWAGNVYGPMDGGLGGGLGPTGAGAMSSAYDSTGIV